MREFCSWTLAPYLILLAVLFQSGPAARYPANEDFRSQTITIPEWQLQKLTLVNLGQTYQTIPSTKTAVGRSHLQLTLKVGIRLQNISVNHAVLSLDTSSFRLVKTLVIPESLVGPVDATSDLRSPQISVEPCKSVGPPTQVLKVMPGESYEITEELKFDVLNDGPADLSQSLNPGVYYLRATIEMVGSWELGGETTFDWFVCPKETTLMKFTVKAKPRQT